MSGRDSGLAWTCAGAAGALLGALLDAEALLRLGVVVAVCGLAFTAYALVKGI